MIQRLQWLLFLLHLSLPAIGQNCAGTQPTSLLQVDKPSTKTVGLVPGSWRSSRDLANVTQIPPILVGQNAGKDLYLHFTSAVPVFGPDGNYIALVHPYHDEIWQLSQRRNLFCSGANSTLRKPIRVVGGEGNVGNKIALAFLCDWPEEEAHLDRFEVFLEDSEGVALGSVLAERKAGMLQQYGTVVCVRDTYPSNRTGLKMLPQWLEFNLAHGVDHFFVYTVNIDEPHLADIYEPYIQSGKATRIHFDYDFDPGDFKDRTLHQMTTSDCVFRAKNHAQWVLPTYDIDEFLVTKDGSLFPGGVVPQDYMNSTWDAAVQKLGLRRDQIHSIVFPLYRFQPAAPGELAFRSMVRENRIQATCPKFVFNPKVVNTVGIHWVTSFDKGTHAITLTDKRAVAHHYKMPDGRVAFSVPNVSDQVLALEVDTLEDALTKRFGRPASRWLKELEEVPLVTRRLSSTKVPFSLIERDPSWQLEEDLLFQRFEPWITSINSGEGLKLIDPPEDPRTNDGKFP